MPLVAVLATSQMLCLSSESNAVAHTRCDKRIKMAHQLWGVCLHDPILTQVLLLCKCYAIVSVNRRRRLNGSTSTTQRCSESETQLPVYKKRIRRLYANKDQLATFDQNLLFSKPCEEVLKYKLPMMKKWCETTKQHFQKMKEKKDRNDKNKQQDIRNFFQPRTSIVRKSTKEPPRRDVSTLQPP